MRKIAKSRNLRKVTTEKVSELFPNDLARRLENMHNVNEAVNLFELEMKNLMDKIPPIKSKVVTERKLNIWHNDSIKEQKKTTRKKENEWRRGRKQSQWDNFKYERNKLVKLIRQEKRNVISDKIISVGEIRRSYTGLSVN